MLKNTQIIQLRIQNIDKYIEEYMFFSYFIQQSAKTFSVDIVMRFKLNAIQ